MVSKLHGSKPSAVRSSHAAPAKKPAKPTAATPAKQGWGATGAAKAGMVGSPAHSGASSVKLLSASIGDGPTAKGFPAPKGFTVQTANDNRKESIKLADGRTATMEWSSQTLTAKGPDGKTVTLVGKDNAAFDQYKADFKEAFEGVTKADLELSPMPDWSSERGFTGAGAAGKLLSVSQGVSDYTGGAHPNSGSSLVTYDTSTGRQVKLDELLSKEQFKAICDTITTALPKLKGEDDVDGNAFQPYQDMAAMVAENFSVSTDSRGKAQITVAWESGVHALGGQMATFTFAAPTDAAFKQKVGLE